MVDLLLIVAAIWLIAASWTDMKKREVSDWLSFSLIAIALSIRAAESVIQWNYEPILTGLLGLLLFFAISIIMYYGKLFAGGDVKLMTALGAVIPSFAFLSNILIAGSIYGLIYSAVLASMNLKGFYSHLFKHKNAFIISLLISLIFFAGYIFTSNVLVLMIAVSILAISIVFIFVNSVEKSCLIKKVSPDKLTVGDWLLKDVKIKGKTIKADFDGLTKNQIGIIRKSKMRVYVKYGIPFIPVFLIAFILTILFGNIFVMFI